MTAPLPSKVSLSAPAWIGAVRLMRGLLVFCGCPARVKGADLDALTLIIRTSSSYCLSSLIQTVFPDGPDAIAALTADWIVV